MPANSVAGVVSRASPYGLDEALSRFEALLQQRGIAVFAHIDQAAEAARVGLSLRPTHLLVFGNPRAGTPLMAAAPLVALELPLKLLVWQDADRQVWFTYQDAAFVAQRYQLPAELQPPLAAVGALVDALVTGASA
jgi:uncharacterized protein (DUF302 family)